MGNQLARVRNHQPRKYSKVKEWRNLMQTVSRESVNIIVTIALTVGLRSINCCTPPPEARWQVKKL